MSDDAADLKAKTTAEVESTPQGIVRRWLSELETADKAEETWRKEVDDIWKLYEGESQKADSFNILWSNTETLAPALYNSTPQPDVRRRYRDKDPLGKAASSIIERECAYQLDQYDSDAAMQDVVLDILITGRGVSRKKYEPSFAPQSAPEAGDPESQTPQEGSTPGERLIDETVENEHVQWDKFRRGPGKRWKDVGWIAFEHDFTYEMALEKFGEEIADKLSYSDTEGSKSTKGGDRRDKEERSIFKVTAVQEIWDRDQRRVLFIAPCYKEAPCLMLDDPLKLRGFYPMPRPVYAIANTRTLVPTPPYRMYKQQAKELNLVSARINKIVSALKVRGAYSANLPEIASILGSNDTDMTPVANVSEIASVGGLDKAIWLMPLEKLRQALDSLYIARDQIKQAIYEISGIGDIMRGVSDPNETKGAQVLKSQWGSLRLQKMQREVQRFVRDNTRIDAEIASERFSMDTLKATTNVQLPMMSEKQQAMQAAQQMQQAGQPVPPELQEMLQKPSWEEVMQLLRTDVLRTCRIDIETNSTVAETVTQDMEGLNEVVSAIGELIVGSVPAVQSGIIPAEAVKEMAMAIVRRARMGPAVEDAIDQIQAPPPAPPSPEAEQGQQMQQDAQKSMQETQAKEQQVKQQQADLGMQQKDMEMQKREAELGLREQTLKQHAEQFKGQADLQAQKTEMAEADHGQFAQAAGQVAQQQQQISQQTIQGLQSVQKGLEAVLAQMQQSEQSIGEAVKALVETMSKPKKISFERGAGNKITGATASIN